MHCMWVSHSIGSIYTEVYSLKKKKKKEMLMLLASPREISDRLVAQKWGVKKACSHWFWCKQELPFTCSQLSPWAFQLRLELQVCKTCGNLKEPVAKPLKICSNVFDRCLKLKWTSLYQETCTSLYLVRFIMWCFHKSPFPYAILRHMDVGEGSPALDPNLWARKRAVLADSCYSWGYENMFYN